MERTNQKTTTLVPKLQIAYALLGFLLGLAPLAAGVMPFGCALLCAMPKKGRKETLFGVLLSAFFDACVPLALFCSGYIYFVLPSKEKSGGVYTYVRLLLSFSISALRASYIAITGVNDISGMFRLIAAIIAYPAFTYAFTGFFDKKKEIRQKHYDISLLSFAFAFTLLLSPFEIGGVSLAIAPATAFTLCAARIKGFAFGGVYGIACGLVSGGAATGALGVLGMTYGLLANEIEPFALVLSFMLSVSGYFYLAGAEGTVTAGAIFLAVFIAFVPLRKKLPILRRETTSAEKRAYDRRLARYAATFSSLSSLFYTVSDATKEESITDLNSRIVKTVDSYCSHCDGCELDKSEISNFFTSEYRRNGVTAYHRIPVHISSKCPNACAMARSVNNLQVVRERDGEKGLRQIADEYSAISSILIEGAKKQDNTHFTDKILGDKIKNSLSEVGVSCDGVRVQGTRLRTVTAYGVQPDKIKRTPNEISAAVASEMKTCMSAPELIMHDDYILMRFKTAPAFKVECAKISQAKSGETVCGDTVSVFENDEKYFYCLVSDGMGSGRDAALTSRLSAIMLEKLLNVGAEKESALRLLNKALAEKDQEVFATVDLLEIDRINSTATVIKAGAAPTILIRGGKTALIESHTPPAGIMDKVIADKRSFRIQKGDMIVMVSDGILQTGSECNLLPKEGIPPMPSARALAGKIMREAQCNAENPDDMSVCVLRIY